MNSNDNDAYSGAYTELNSNHHGVENDFANIFLLNEQANQIDPQIYVNSSHNDHEQHNFSTQIETHMPDYQYSTNITDYMPNNYQNNQDGKL